jgi:hypothetical protein
MPAVLTCHRYAAQGWSKLRDADARVVPAIGSAIRKSHHHDQSSFRIWTDTGGTTQSKKDIDEKPPYLYKPHTISLSYRYGRFGWTIKVQVAWSVMRLVQFPATSVTMI